MGFTEQERYEQWRHAHGFDKQAMPTYYHITDNPDFKPEGDANGGLFLSRNPDWWNTEPVIGRRPYRAEVDVPDDLADEWGSKPYANANEIRIPPEQYHRLKVKSVGPNRQASRWFTAHGFDKHARPRDQDRAKMLDITASRWYIADFRSRADEEDDAWNQYHDDDEYTPTAEEADWLRDDSNEIPDDPEVEAQARQDAIGDGGAYEDAAHDELADMKNKDWNTYSRLITPKDHGSQGARPPMTMEPVGNLATDGVMARHAADGRPIGHLMWTPGGTIASVNTHPDFQGRGVANAMLHHARSNPEIYHDGESPIHHSDELTPHGEAWARSDPHHTMPKNFTSVPVRHGQGTKKPYSNFLGAGQEYIPASQRYSGQTEDFMKANSFVGKDVKGYTGTKPPPREYVPPGRGHLGEHYGPKATTMNWGGGSGQL